MTEERQRTTIAAVAVIAVIALAAATAGCAGSPPADEGRNASATDAYLSAYIDGMDRHQWAQDAFNNGTLAWDNSDFRQAIANYGNASAMYDMAARSYARMAQYAETPQDRAFGESLRGCAFNLSMAADRFMNAAIALEQNQTEAAYALFEEGQVRVAAGDAMLNRSIELTPDWMLNLTSG